MSDEYDYEWKEPEDYFEEDDLEEGEVNLFSSMPWINSIIGSLMEYQLIKYKELNQCRNCGKIDESLRAKNVSERFCSEKCSKEWHNLFETRIVQGKHDLRTRGFD